MLNERGMNPEAIADFMRSLPTEQKPRGRFDRAAREWRMSDSEKIRLAKMFAAAGYPGWPVPTYG